MPRCFRYESKFTIRLTLAERRRLGARAAAAGLSLSRYLVEAGLSDRVPTPQDRAQRDRALFHLRKVGINLNQIARRLNGQQAVPPATVEAALRTARQVLEQVGETV